MTPLEISSIVLWILQIATIVVVVGLARQIGVLHLRMPPLGAGRKDGGPVVGAHYELPPVESLRGHQIPILVPGSLTLVAFASPTCGVCAPVMEAIRRLRASEKDIQFVVTVDGGQEQALEYAGRYGMTDISSSDSLGVLSINSRPFAVALSGDGTVLAAGVPNTLEQLEILLAQARHQEIHEHDPEEAGQEPASAAAEAGNAVAEFAVTDS